MDRDRLKFVLKVVIAIVTLVYTPPVIILGLMALGTITTAFGDLMVSHQPATALYQMTLALGLLACLGLGYYIIYRYVLNPVINELFPPRPSSRS